MNMTAIRSQDTQDSALVADRELPFAENPNMVDPARRSLIRRLAYRVWPFVPSFGRRLAFGLAARRVTLGVCAVITDSRGRILVAHHTYRWQAWGLPGGLVGKREQPLGALERELREELGVAARVGSLLCTETECGHLTLYYGASMTGVPRPDGVEIDHFRYASRAELTALFGRHVPTWLTYVWERQAS